MDVREAIVHRIRALCRERGITPNGLSNLAGVPQATVKSILNGESRNPDGAFGQTAADTFFPLPSMNKGQSSFLLVH